MATTHLPHILERDFVALGSLICNQEGKCEALLEIILSLKRSGKKLYKLGVQQKMLEMFGIDAG